MFLKEILDIVGLQLITCRIEGSENQMTFENNNCRVIVITDPETSNLQFIEVEDLNFGRIYYMVAEDFALPQGYDVMLWIPVELELEEDLLEKLEAIWNYDAYDDRILIPLDVTDADLFLIMKAAHLRDQTLNEFIMDALNSALNVAS